MELLREASFKLPAGKLYTCQGKRKFYFELKKTVCFVLFVFKFKKIICFVGSRTKLNSMES